MLAISTFSFIGLHIPNFIHSVNFIDVVFAGDYTVIVMVLLTLIVHGNNHKFYLYWFMKPFPFPLIFLQICPFFRISRPLSLWKFQIKPPFYFCLSSLSINCHSVFTCSVEEWELLWVWSWKPETWDRILSFSCAVAFVLRRALQTFLSVCLLEILFSLVVKKVWLQFWFSNSARCWVACLCPFPITEQQNNEWWFQLPSSLPG